MMNAVLHIILASFAEMLLKVTLLYMFECQFNFNSYSQLIMSVLWIWIKH